MDLSGLLVVMSNAMKVLVLAGALGATIVVASTEPTANASPLSPHDGVPRPAVTEPDKPQAIVGGDAVAECGWPSVVSIYKDADPDDRCTGVYVGGRTILTVAHCTGSDFTIPVLCESDGDCPDLGEFDDDIGGLQCAPDGMSCFSPDPLVSNKVRQVRFGEDYPALAEDGNPRKAVAVAYCRQKADVMGGLNDFAYCILTEEPGVQPIPIIMQCEVDANLDNSPEFFDIGFGKSDLNQLPEGAPGTKRWAKTDPIPVGQGPTSSYATWVLPGGVGWTTGGGAPCDGPAKGDSGSPLFAELPDGTWRVVGVALTDFPEYNLVWNHVPWLLQDPNISQDDLIPCHDQLGAWTGGVACGESPTSPDQPAGSWTRGAGPCFSTATTQRTDTCPPMAAAPAKPTELAGLPTTSPDAPRAMSGSCRVDGTDRPVPLGAALCLLFMAARRRRIKAETR